MPGGRVGDKIELVEIMSPSSVLVPGDRGVIRRVDHTGSISVEWENGFYVLLIPGVDAWRVLEEV